MRFHRLHRSGIVRYLTATQKEALCAQFDVADVPLLDRLILEGNDEARRVLRAACATLGVKSYYPQWVNCGVRSGYVRRGGRRRGT